MKFPNRQYSKNVKCLNKCNKKIKNFIIKKLFEACYITGTAAADLNIQQKIKVLCYRVELIYISEQVIEAQQVGKFPLI